jgi:hypothetical protein
MEYWYEYHMEDSIGVLDTKLNTDCLFYILSLFPYIVWMRCEGCGLPLLRKSGDGSLFVCQFTKYSFSYCDMCYIMCQT